GIQHGIGILSYSPLGRGFLHYSFKPLPVNLHHRSVVISLDTYRFYAHYVGMRKCLWPNYDISISISLYFQWINTVLYEHYVGIISEYECLCIFIIVLVWLHYIILSISLFSIYSNR
ncbi:hypothetical protein ACJX0J_031386, partial [Zea mays]